MNQEQIFCAFCSRDLTGLACLHDMEKNLHFCNERCSSAHRERQTIANAPVKKAILAGLSSAAKSVLLAQAMGWKVEVWATGEYGRRGEQYKAYWTKPDGSELDSDVVGYSEQEAIEGQVTNFYEPGNFAEAWLVVNWAYNMQAADYKFFSQFVEWYYFGQWKYQIIAIPLAEALAAILDKILELCFEAGLVSGEGQ